MFIAFCHRGRKMPSCWMVSVMAESTKQWGKEQEEGWRSLIRQWDSTLSTYKVKNSLRSVSGMEESRVPSWLVVCAWTIMLLCYCRCLARCLTTWKPFLATMHLGFRPLIRQVLWTACVSWQKWWTLFLVAMISSAASMIQRQLELLLHWLMQWSYVLAVVS